MSNTLLFFLILGFSVLMLFFYWYKDIKYIFIFKSVKKKELDRFIEEPVDKASQLVIPILNACIVWKMLILNKSKPFDDTASRAIYKRTISNVNIRKLVCTMDEKVHRDRQATI